YQPQVKQQSYLKIVEDAKPVMELKQVWDAYLAYIEPSRKPKTLLYLHKTISPKIRRCEFQDPTMAIEVRNWLLSVTTPSMTKRVLIQINAAIKWAIKHNKLAIAVSPFDGMAYEFKHNYEKETTPNAFTVDERDRVIDAFRNHKVKGGGFSYKYYVNFVEFMFLTGCRPHEAVELQWKRIDCSWRFIEFPDSKTGRFRKFPINERLRELLQSIPQKSDLVFPAPQGGQIDYGNFSDRAWDAVVDPIKPDTTPYCCRDTFITEQVIKNVNTAVIAKWVDNSVKMIEKHYLDMTAIDHILPQ
ncbi:MAG: tyrosine-type recombinase/integrase, partial [Xenococcaceae cyanobacterium]